MNPSTWPHGGVHVSSVHVLQLGVGDLLQLSAGDLADLVLHNAQTQGVEPGLPLPVVINQQQLQPTAPRGLKDSCENALHQA